MHGITSANCLQRRLAADQCSQYPPQNTLGLQQAMQSPGIVTRRHPSSFHAAAFHRPRPLLLGLLYYPSKQPTNPVKGSWKRSKLAVFTHEMFTIYVSSTVTGLTQLLHADLHWLDVPERVRYKLCMMIVDARTALLHSIWRYTRHQSLRLHHGGIFGRLPAIN